MGNDPDESNLWVIFGCCVLSCLTIVVIGVLTYLCYIPDYTGYLEGPNCKKQNVNTLVQPAAPTPVSQPAPTPVAQPVKKRISIVNGSEWSFGLQFSRTRNGIREWSSPDDSQPGTTKTFEIPSTIPSSGFITLLYKNTGFCQRPAGQCCHFQIFAYENMGNNASFKITNTVLPLDQSDITITKRTNVFNYAGMDCVNSQLDPTKLGTPTSYFNGDPL